MKIFLFNRPLFRTFFENLAKTLPQIFTAANIFSRPLLSSAAEYSGNSACTVVPPYSCRVGQLLANLLGHSCKNVRPPRKKFCPVIDFNCLIVFISSQKNNFCVFQVNLIISYIRCKVLSYATEFLSN
jgi:hypothetical protein